MARHRSRGDHFFLVGVAIFGFGSLALVRRVLDNWQRAVWLPAVGMAAVAIIVPTGFFFAARQRRTLALGVALFWLGWVAIALATQGFAQSSCAMIRIVPPSMVDHKVISNELDQRDHPVHTQTHAAD